MSKNCKLSLTSMASQSKHNTQFNGKQDSLKPSLNIHGVFHLQVVAEANNGKGEFMVSVKPKAPLCDGMFHKISGKIQSFTNGITGDKLKNFPRIFDMFLP